MNNFNHNQNLHKMFINDCLREQIWNPWWSHIFFIIAKISSFSQQPCQIKHSDFYIHSNSCPQNTTLTIVANQMTRLAKRMMTFQYVDRCLQTCKQKRLQSCDNDPVIHRKRQGRVGRWRVSRWRVKSVEGPEILPEAIFVRLKIIYRRCQRIVWVFFLD